MRRIRALTLWPEWVPAFTHMQKRVENRPWAPTADLIKGMFERETPRLALHAGVSWPGPKSERWLRFEAVANKAGYLVSNVEPGKMLVTRPNVRGFRMVDVPLGHVFARCSIHMVTNNGAVEQCVRASSLERAPELQHDPWAFGPYCWWLEKLAILDEPVPARGHQKLWWWEAEDLHPAKEVA